MVDALVLETSEATREGSSPFFRTKKKIMKVTITSSKNLQSTLKIVVEKKEIDVKIEVRLSELKNTINLKGFRPGKAPMELLKKQFGSSVYGEVAEKLLQESTFQALKEKNIIPASPVSYTHLRAHET